MWRQIRCALYSAMADSLDDKRCSVHPSTIVYTRGGPKVIRDVCPGDEVVTRTGAFVAVALVHRNHYQGLLLDIGGRGQVCEHHRLLSGTDEQFVQADKLRPGEILRCVIPKCTEDIPELSEEDCLLYGVITVSGRVDGDNLVFLRHNMLSSAVEEILDAIGRNVLRDQGVGSLVFLSPFRCDMLLDESKKMRFYTPLLHLCDAKLDKLRQGLWYGSTASGDLEDREKCIAVSDRGLAEVIRYCFLRIGMDLEYDGEVLRKPPGPVAATTRGCVDREITSIDTQEFSGEVFDLETIGDCDEERTYLTSIGISHNGRGGSSRLKARPS
jgi:hypothetical protein